MIDFYTQQNSTVEFVKNELAKFLPEEVPEPELYVNDFVDLDKYRKNRTVFFQFAEYALERTGVQIDTASLTLNVYLVYRQDVPEKLTEYVRKAATAFYSMFEESGRAFGGIFDYGKVETVDFFDSVEGMPGIKAVQFALTLSCEA